MSKGIHREEVAGVVGCVTVTIVAASGLALVVGIVVTVIHFIAKAW